MRAIEAEVEIDAPAEVVWEVLVDLDSYAEWNPFVVEAEGSVARGERLTVRIEPPGSRGATFRPVVLAAERARRFEWLGRFLLPKVFDGHHQFLIHPLGGDRVRFVQREEFSGVLVPVFLDEDATAQGFGAMNEALKQRVEEQVRA